MKWLLLDETPFHSNYPSVLVRFSLKTAGTNRFINFKRYMGIKVPCLEVNEMKSTCKPSKNLLNWKLKFTVRCGKKSWFGNEFSFLIDIDFFHCHLWEFDDCSIWKLMIFNFLITCQYNTTVMLVRSADLLRPFKKTRASAILAHRIRFRSYF